MQAYSILLLGKSPLESIPPVNGPCQILPGELLPRNFSHPINCPLKIILCIHRWR